ncbi:unnamed protein product [Calypogeia fissa]
MDKVKSLKREPDSGFESDEGPTKNVRVVDYHAPLLRGLSQLYTRCVDAIEANRRLVIEAGWKEKHDDMERRFVIKHEEFVRASTTAQELSVQLKAEKERYNQLS